MITNLTGVTRWQLVVYRFIQHIEHSFDGVKFLLLLK